MLLAIASAVFESAARSTLDAAKALTYLEASVLMSTQPSLIYHGPLLAQSFHDLSVAQSQIMDLVAGVRKEGSRYVILP